MVKANTTFKNPPIHYETCVDCEKNQDVNLFNRRIIYGPNVYRYRCDHCCQLLRDLDNTLSLMKKAHKAVREAVKSGELQRKDCEICNSSKQIEAHHESYLKEDWLKVNWFCHIHHMKRHREINLQRKQSLIA